MKRACLWTKVATVDSLSLMKTDEERGPQGAWLVASRMSRKWTQKQARLAVAQAGHPIAASVYAEYESGTKPVSRRDLPALLAFWGMPDESEPAGLAAAISALVEELRAARQERQSTEARLRAVEAELESLRAPRVGAESSGQSSLPQTAG